MTFKIWLRRFKDDDSELGEFANEIIADPDFPRTRRLGMLVEYLFAKDVGLDVIRLFYEAYQEYYFVQVKK
jgi:uncharacterized protein YozE (UPF0346 family)